MLLQVGDRCAKILIIVDPPDEKDIRSRSPISGKQKSVLRRLANDNSINPSDCFIVSPCGVIPQEACTEKKKKEHLASFSEEFDSILSKSEYGCVLVFGSMAAKQLTKKSVKITKLRGSHQVIDDTPVFFCNSLRQACVYPENMPTLKSDFSYFSKLLSNNFEVEEPDINHIICTDLSKYRNDLPELLYIDTETTSLDWAGGDLKILTAQIALDEDTSLVLPIHKKYKEVWGFKNKSRERLIRQLCDLLTNKSYKKAGHNFKYDCHAFREDLGVDVVSWVYDTMVMAFFVDDNTKFYSLEECVKRYVPELAGYDEDFSNKYDKSAMFSVPLDDLKIYGGMDVVAGLRLIHVLNDLANKNPRNYLCYSLVTNPALNMFVNVERHGMKVDRHYFEVFKEELRKEVLFAQGALLRQVPLNIKLKHEDKGIKFSRSTFTNDVFFGEGSFRKLKPVKFTPGSKHEEVKIPSTSIKEHFSYFVDIDFFARDYVQFKKLSSVYTSFVKNYSKYFDKDSTIHPSYNFHRTATGRLSASNPSSQNQPKRSVAATNYRKSFIPREGFVIVEADFSQVELRVAAHVAKAKNMIKAYRTGQDLHTLTAANTLGISLEKFSELPKKVQKSKRTSAKGINFGFLYGMLAKSFRTYVKTEWSMDITIKEAEANRDAYFRMNPELLVWHEASEAHLRKYGYVESPHGPRHHYPSINSDDFFVQIRAIRQAINAPIQRFASDICQIGLHRVFRDFDDDICHAVGSIHDSGIFEIREEYAEEYMSYIKWYMENPPLWWFDIKLSVPLIVDFAVGSNLGSVEEIPGGELQAVKPDFFSSDDKDQYIYRINT